MEATPQNGQIVTEADDRVLRVRFHAVAVQNNVESEKAGRPIFNDKDFVEIRIPGDRNTVIDQEANDEHKARFPSAWARYMNGKGDELVGTPIEHWGILSPSQIMELKALNMPTVDLLATCADGFLGKFMGLRELRTKAQAFLKASVERGAIVKLQAELSQRDAKIDELTEKLETLSRAVEAMQEASPEAAAVATRSKRAPKAPAPELNA